MKNSQRSGYPKSDLPTPYPAPNAFLPSHLSQSLLHFRDIKFYMRFQLQVFVMSALDFAFDVLFQVRHL